MGLVSSTQFPLPRSVENVSGELIRSSSSGSRGTPDSQAHGCSLPSALRPHFRLVKQRGWESCRHRSDESASVPRPRPRRMRRRNCRAERARKISASVATRHGHDLQRRISRRSRKQDNLFIADMILAARIDQQAANPFGFQKKPDRCCVESEKFFRIYGDQHGFFTIDGIDRGFLECKLLPIRSGR